MSCTTAAVYSNIKHCPGTSMSPGIRSEVYFIEQSKITAWPTANPQTGKFASDGTFTLASGASWHTIKGIKSMGSVEAAPVGSKPCKSFDVTLNVFIPGLHADVIAFANQATNDDLVFAYQDANGDVKVIGYEFGEVDVNPTGSTGSGSGDTLGETCAITCNMPYQPLILSGISALGTIASDASSSSSSSSSD